MAKKGGKTDASAEKEKEEKWRYYPVEDYQQAAGEMVHFSFKTVNSNSAGGGVRLGLEDALDLPYVAVRTLMAAGCQLDRDYTKNAGVTANLAKQIRAVFAGEQPKTVENPQSIRDACLVAFAGRMESNCETVSPRMRQLLLPKGDSYVAISPVGAGGLNAVINARVKMHNDNRDKAQQAWIGQAQFGIGGANPQNVGGLIREMQRPLYFEAPTEAPWLRAALSIHYKGIPLMPPRDLMLAYRAWRAGAKAKNDGRMPTDMRAREREESFVEGLTAAILARGTRALQVLREHGDHLPHRGAPLVDVKVDPVVRGVIDPSLRQKDWAYRFAWRTANQLAAYQFRDDQGGLGLDDAAVAWTARRVEEALR